MNKFIKELSYDYVANFGKSLQLKNYHIRKNMEGWHIIFDSEEKVGYNLTLTDFYVSSMLDKEFCKKATNLWRISLYKKFGTKYLKALKEHELFNVRMRSKIERGIVLERIEGIKEQAENEK